MKTVQGDPSSRLSLLRAGANPTFVLGVLRVPDQERRNDKWHQDHYQDFNEREVEVHTERMDRCHDYAKK